MVREMTMAEKEGGAWGTLEELVLVCAVIRYGTESWDSIAVEVQKCATLRNGGSQRSDESSGERTSFLEAFTPRNCERRYHSLKRRFNVTGGGERNDTPAGDDGNDGENEQPEKLPFLVDELRKLRVEELRREVERRDDSIVSLQLKVKRLEGERRKSSTKAESANGEADLETGADRNDAGVEQRGREPVGSSTEAAAPGERFDEPQDRSFNESNSSSHKEAPSQGRESNRRRKPAENRKNEPVQVRPTGKSKPDRDCSTSQGVGPDGGSGVVGKAAGRTSQPVRLGDSSESKRDAKQSSDVQSSASLSRRKQRDRRRNDAAGVGSSGDDTAEELSPANKKVDVKSQPLANFLEILRSHKHGSVFHRRLPSQETKKYRNLIRQHMDLETVRSKLDRGSYRDSHPKFYRDILLIFTNATTFFPKSSAEHAAARELRHLIERELTAQLTARKPEPTPTVKPEPELPVPDPVAEKPKSSADIVVCRRRTTKKGDGGKGESKKESSDEDEEEPINERRKQLALSKREGAANFLKRIKQPSPSEKEKPKKTEVNEKKTVGAGKKLEGKAGGGEDGGATKRRSSGKAEEIVRSEKVKRAARPAAVKADAGAPPPDSGRAKRRREVEESSRSEKKKPKR